MKSVSKKLNGKFNEENDQKPITEKSQEQMEIDVKDGLGESESESDADAEVDESEDQADDKGSQAKNLFNGKETKPSKSKITLKTNKTIKNKKPPTNKMVDEAIKELNERTGSSIEAVKKFIMAKDPTFDEKRLKGQITRYIKKCLVDGTMIQIKRSFKLTNKHMAKKKQIAKEKLKAKKEKEADQQKLKKEKQKQQQKTDNTKEKVKSTASSKSVKSSKISKDKKKIVNGPKEAEAKPKPNTKAKADNAVPKVKATEIKAKTQNVKPKGKLARKSINLVVRLTPPRHQKTIKKSKTTTKVTNKTIDIKADVTATTTIAAAPLAIKSSKNSKKK